MARVCVGERDDDDDDSIHMDYHGTYKQHLVPVGGGEYNGASRRLGGGSEPGDQMAFDAYYAVTFSIDGSYVWFDRYFPTVHVRIHRARARA